MTWEYGLIGLVVGLIIGGLVTRFGSKQVRDQHALQYELNKTKAELNEYKQELNDHFTRSAELMENLTQNYRELYQHMTHSSHQLLPEQRGEQNPFTEARKELTDGADNAQVQMPRDYSSTASGLLRSESSTK